MQWLLLSPMIIASSLTQIHVGLAAFPELYTGYYLIQIWFDSFIIIAFVAEHSFLPLVKILNLSLLVISLG
jgi:hypothetical protein